MATSGSFKKIFSSGFTLLVEWAESEVDTAKNQSDVTVTVKLQAASGYAISSSADKKITLTVDGVTYSSTCKIGISSGATKTLLTKKVSDITHNGDGSKNVAISCTLGVAATLNGSYIASVATSGNAALTKIARKSTLSVANGKLGTAQTVTITEQTSSFKHRLKYECGSASGWILGSGSDYSTALSTSWTPPISLASQNKEGTSVQIVFTLSTYTSDGDLVGSNSYTKTFAIPDSVKPTVTLSVSDTTGYLSKYGQYIQNKSRLKIKVTATKSYDSPIKSYKTTADKETYTGTEIDTDVISGYGKLEITVTVTDARGRTGTAKTTIDVLRYTPPKITSMTVNRCDEDGTPNKEGAYLSVVFDAEITPLLQKNTANYTIEYTSTKDGKSKEDDMTDFMGMYTVTSGKFVFAADTTSSYNVVIHAIDDFYDVSKDAPGSSMIAIISYCKSKLRLAIGKIAEIDNLFDVALNTIFRGDVEIKGKLTVTSDWTPLTLEDNFVTYNNNAANQPKYKVTGNTVTIKGIVSPKTAFTSESTWVTFAKGLPTEICPDISLTSVCQGSGINRWALNVDSNGNLSIGRYGATSFADVPTSAWLPFCFTYQI